MVGKKYARESKNEKKNIIGNYGGKSGCVFVTGDSIGGAGLGCRGYVPIIPEYYLVNAIPPMFDGVGVCDNYAAEFMLLTRAIGLESYVYNGQTRIVSGGFTGHAWNEMPKQFKLNV